MEKQKLLSTFNRMKNIIFYLYNKTESCCGILPKKVTEMNSEDKMNYLFIFLYDCNIIVLI